MRETAMSYRIVQWATGAMGKSCLRAIIDHPETELVGLFVYGENKAGKDAGEIARRAPTGVIATRDPEAILALDADVVVHCARLAPPYGSHDRDLIALLASGKNVISINGYSHPAHWDGERLAALEQACRTGGSSLMAAGLNPGFAAEQMAAIASGVCTELDAIEVTECVDCRTVRNPDYVFKILGFGTPVDAINANDPNWGPAASLNGMYEEVLAALAARLQLRLLKVSTEHRVFPATEPLSIAAGAIEPGGVSHVNWRWRAEAEGGRALDNELFDFTTLGPWAEKVFSDGVIQRMMLRETPLGGSSGFVDPAELKRRAEADLRGFGQAMVGRLLAACLARGIEPRLGMKAERLIVEDGRVVGVDFAGGRSIRAERGVILATGGFEWNESLKKAFLRGPLDMPASPPGNTGDGLKLAMSVGAGLGNM
ncbi:MAG: FAD-binding protein, partial [Alphaproteobacteria bacterium]|nr:FAD-binding protein [Alphaproteobacteria bacterium]